MRGRFADEIDLWLGKEIESSRFLRPLGRVAAGTAAVVSMALSTRSGLALPARPALVPPIARALPDPPQDRPVPLILPARPVAPASRPESRMAEVDAAKPLVGNMASQVYAHDDLQQRGKHETREPHRFPECRRSRQDEVSSVPNVPSRPRSPRARGTGGHSGLIPTTPNDIPYFGGTGREGRESRPISG